MRRTHLWLYLTLVSLLFSSSMKARQADTRKQAQEQTTSRTIVFNGTLKNSGGHAQAGTVGITVTLYESQTGGVALWQESATVDVDEQGRYSFLLGSTSKEGLPPEIYHGYRKYWLDISSQGGERQSRVPLLVARQTKTGSAVDTGPSNDSGIYSAASPQYSGGSLSNPLMLTSGTQNQVVKYGPSSTLIDSAVTETNGNVGIGTTAPVSQFNVLSTTSSSPRGITSEQYNSGGDGAQLRSRKARGTPDSPATVQSGDVLAAVIIDGYDGSAFVSGAQIRSVTEEAWTGSAHGTNLSFQTTAPGTTSASERIRITGAGNVGIGTTNPSERLDLGSGNFKTTGYGAVAGGYYNTTGAVGWNHGDGTKFQIRTNTTDGMMVVDSSGNVGIGTTTPQAKLDVVGNVNVNGNIAAKYQDLAEWVSSDVPIEPAAVVIIDPDKPDHVLPAAEPYDTRVAGVISSTPGIVLGEAGQNKVKVATTGRVRVKVDATRSPIRIGDLLVTSGISGLATRSEPAEIGKIKIHRPGTVLGKALEPLSSGRGEILVLLSLQ